MSSLTSSLPFGLGGAWLAEHTLRTVGAGLALFDRDSRLVEVDSRSAGLLSLHDASGIGASLDDPRWAAIHLDGRPLDPSTDPVRAALATTSSTVADIIGVEHDSGDTRWLATTALPIPGLDGRSQAALVSFVEVTGVIRDRVAVDLAQRLGRSAFDYAAVPMCVVDTTGYIRDWNRAFAALIDRPDYEIVATHFDRWFEDGETTLRSVEPSGGPDASASVVGVDGRPLSLRCWACGPDEPPHLLVELSPLASDRTGDS